MVVKENVNDRIDIYLTSNTDYSRSFIKENLKSGNILVNGSVVKSSYIPKEGDEISFNIIDDDSIIKQDIPLNIIYEDEYIIVLNKPSGLVVHPGAGNKNNTLVNGLLFKYDKLSDVNGPERPGIVHRLDKDTSGLLVVAKTNEAHIKLQEDFMNDNIVRNYICLVMGNINNDYGKIVAPIGRSNRDKKKMAVINEGKEAITTFEVIERYNKTSLVRCSLHTGRTHQIRVHMAYIGHPVVNDPLYGKPFNKYGQMLYCEHIEFNHPITNERLEFTVDAEDEFNTILEKFKN